jgi:Omp85 superfamily domain
MNLVLFGQNDSLTISEKKESFFKRLITDNKTPEQPKFLLYPTLAFSPETSWEIGVSALELYYAKKDTTNRLSEIQSFNFFTLNKQYGSWIEHFLYSDKDRWFFLGKLKLQRFPLQYYGIGPDANVENEQLVNSDYIAVRERVLHRISDNFFGGIEFDFQKISRISFEENDLNLPKPLGYKGSKNFGIGTGLVYDNRHNALNVRNGLFAELAFLKYSTKLGSDFDFNTFSTDIRWFKTVKKSQVLAVQFFGQFVNGTAPFNQLALLGGESIMRGYYYGRFRDKNLMAAQIEYRFLPFPFSKRIGAAGFLSTGTVFPKFSQLQARNVLPAAGLGLRYLIFPKKDIFLRFDVGFTKEGPAFYIFNGEAF